MAVALATVVGLKASAFAATASFTVTSTADAVDADIGDGACASSAGACTLRAAIQETNALPGADTIVVPGGTYAITRSGTTDDAGDFDIADSVVIAGAGASATIIDGGTPSGGGSQEIPGLDRLFEVVVEGATISISDVTLSGGWAAEYGGAILNSSSATIEISGSTLTGSVAGKTGGAIDNHAGGTVSLTGSTLSNNYAAEGGSAVNNNLNGVVTIANSTVSSNSAADVGLNDTLVGAGAISNNAEHDELGTIVVTDSAISENRSGSGRHGAGISNDGAGVVVVSETTFTKNVAMGDGGGIYNVNGQVTVTDSTFSENAATNGGAIASSGDGLVTVSVSSFSKNDAADEGGAVMNGNKGSFAIADATFTENTALNGGGFGNEGSGLVTVDDSTFTKNSAFDAAVLTGGEGGGMHSSSSGEVIVTNAVFTENHARDGGGLANEGSGQTTLTSSRFTANKAEEAGGGILIQAGAVRMVDLDVIGNFSDALEEGGGGISYAGDKAALLEDSAALESSRILDNKAKGQGGGIDSRGDGPLVVTTTTIRGNTAAIGGAIHHVGDAPLAVTRSTLSGNVADNGGGVFTDGDGEALLENTTISANRASQFGGGVLVSSRLHVRSSTVVSNLAAQGGGINNGGGDLIGDGFVVVANTIVASNLTGGNCTGSITSNGGNVENANTCQLTQLTDQPGTNPLLGPLASNGGPTQTHALLAGSPAQDRADCTELDPCPPVDQRGVARPAFASTDVGAYESELAPGGAGTPACVGTTERPVPADFDTWISQSSGNGNFGADAILDVSQGERALVHFTLPPAPPGCELVGATLRLFAASATGGRTLQALRIAAPWSEFSATWNNQPSTAGAAVSTGSGLGVREWDVLDQTLAMYAQGSHGFLIRDQTESGAGQQSLHSREKGTDAPEIVLVFADPDPSPTVPPGDCPTNAQLIDADRDSWVSQSSPTNNFGNDSTLKVKSQTGSNSRALLRFPLPALPPGCTTVTSATLRVNVSSAKEGRTLEAAQLGGAWTETGVTWGNQPPAIGPAAAIPVAASGILEWSVTPQVLSMYTSANNGFVLSDGAENGVGDEQTINSREKTADDPPVLVIAFDASTPETTLGSRPASPTEGTEATFTFTSDRADATFECSLDGAAFAACTSPLALADVAEGGHALEVRATRQVRAIDPTPASHAWIVSIPPETTISGPASPSTLPEATLSFEADDPQATFECALDAPAYEPCTSPVGLEGLSDGEHAFSVRATDPFGNVEPAPPTHTWLVAVPPETAIDSAPDALTNVASASFAFSGSDNGPTTELEFACSLDGGAPATCASGVLYAGLADGEHAFSVLATDGAGNEETEAASYAWTVDTTAPATSVASGPDELTRATSATLAFTSNEAGSTFACRLDGAAFAPCESPASYTDLADGEHVFAVRATDPAGNEHTAGASFTWTVDTTPPETAIDSGPAALTNDASAAFAFSSNEEGSSFACSLDETAYEPCDSPATYTGLADGGHAFSVLATDAAGNVEVAAAVRSWTVDTVAPETTVGSGPDSPTRDTSAGFTFDSSEAGSSFACSLDGAAYSACESPASYAGLAPGAHALAVAATDAAGNTDPTAAEFTWTIDTTPPETSLTSSPAALTKDTAASFAFESSEAGSFACSLDAAPYAACTSPVSYVSLADGLHTFAVQATDIAGNTDPTAAELTWTVDTTPPETSITSSPPALTNATTASFAFGSNENGSTFACSLDGAAFAACASGVSYAGLGDGEHLFQVRATDAAGNEEVAAAVFLWRVDTAPPETAIASGPADPTNASNASFAFGSSETDSTFACSLDGAPYAVCESPLSRAGLAAGEHAFSVRATDAAGNTDQTPASFEWTIDTTPPQTSITAGPAPLTKSAGASFSFESSEAGSSFICSLDGGPFTSCASPATYGGLTDGAHTFEVSATDPAGNGDPTAATRNWTVDTTAPETSISSGPPALTKVPSASFEFGSNEDGSTFACSLDGAAFVACASPAAYEALVDGEHVLLVRATDAAGNDDPTAASYAWTVDTTAPATSISDSPPALTNATSASIAFGSSETDSTFACSLDGAAFTACASPASYVTLDEGPHTFAVAATDAAGNADQTPATSAWTIDTTAPETSITASPPALTSSASATFAFTSSEEGSSFECSLDGAALTDCASPASYDVLDDGVHAFSVRATDAAGNGDATAATRSWTVDTTAPGTSITNAPPAFSSSTSASFSFTSSESGSTFACSLDGAEYVACESAASYTALGDGEHSFAVRATDAAGNPDPVAASHTWTIDTLAPETAITGGPPALTSSTAATVSFVSSDAGSTFACSLDGGAFSTCTSPATYTGLADGEHTVAVRATDAAGNADTSPATRTWTVDATAPETTITLAPPELTGSASASFTFTSDAAGATFACSLDGTAFAACTSPRSYAGLADGEHTFSVRATDTAGNTDASPAGRTWTVDTTPPETSITGAPPAVSGSAQASISFTSSESGSSFECSLDGTAFADCDSPASYTGLADGEHTFSVLATDAAGNADPTAVSATWTVDTAAPDTSITNGPPALTTSTGATFAFTSTHADASFTCALDGAAFSACESPQAYTGLADGPHTFAVRATDSVGNVDESPATRGWTVDTISPDTTITSGPPATTTSTSASFELSASEAGSSFACSLDGAAFASCSSPHEVAGLAPGSHQLRVRATDPAGNTDGSPAVHSWTVQAADTTPPETTITAGPTGPTNGSTPTFEFTASETATFQCRVDAASFVPCSSPHTTATLSQATHTFEVRAIDSAGNVDASAASRSFAVDTTAPQTTITSGPAATTTDPTARFEFTSTETGSSFECSLDGSGFAPCSPPVTYTVGVGPHQFQVRAIDAAGNLDASPSTSSWTVEAGDTTPPETSITAGPNGATNDPTPTFTLSSSESGSTFQCRVDAASFAPCSSPHTTASLAQGPHTFEVRATDSAGNVDQSPALRSITVDTAAPETTITAGPTGPTSDSTPTFEFTASETATFQCRVDSASFTSCSSPHTTASVSTGSHTFQVRAVDAVGNVDSSPASSAFTVDTTAPNTTITQAPPATTTNATVGFQFTASESGSSFECSLDGSGFAPCSSPVTYTVSPGPHQFQVRARDVAGNADASPASASWTYQAADTTPPETTIANGPPATTTNATVSFEFTSSETGSSFACSLDGAGFAPCSSPVSYTVSVGSHQFQVRAQDAAGNVDETPASRSWTREDAPPGSCTGSTVTLGATADSWLLESSSTSNYGNDSVLKVDTKSGANARALVRFSLPALPPGCQVLDAELRLYAGSYKTGRTIDVYALTSAWGESSVTWSSQPAPAGSASSASSGEGYVEWDVTAQLASTYAANTGFLVRDRTENGNGVEQGFHSREKGTDNPPRLVVTFG